MEEADVNYILNTTTCFFPLCRSGGRNVLKTKLF
jgi:hypothetical protein